MLQQLDVIKLNEAVNLAQKLPGYFQCNDVRQAVLVSMCYQLGGLELWPHLRLALARGDYAATADAMLTSKWAVETPARAQREITMMKTGEWVPHVQRI